MWRSSYSEQNRTKGMGEKKRSSRINKKKESFSCIEALEREFTCIFFHGKERCRKGLSCLLFIICKFFFFNFKNDKVRKIHILVFF